MNQEGILEMFDFLHDVIISTTNESSEFYSNFSLEFDIIKMKIMDL